MLEFHEAAISNSGKTISVKSHHFETLMYVTQHWASKFDK